jgi:hypothetical protein
MLAIFGLVLPVGAEQLTLAPAGDTGYKVVVSGPDGYLTEKVFKPGETAIFETANLDQGLYKYEAWPLPVVTPEVRAIMDKARQAGDLGAIEKLVAEGKLPGERSVKSGTFRIQGKGSVVDSTVPEEHSTKDVLHYDDVIITGSLCVGFDCANGESFGYSTIKLKENNLQLHFEDTSVGSFPTGDWKIQINDTTSGGASYFTVWDINGGRRVATFEAGAPSHSLYVEDYGRVGLGTSIPYVELHIVDGDSPTIRLDQDGSSGWTAQRWDLCGNETNFFIRDVTNGSKLCFRIQPNTPSNTLCMRSTGYVGIGTWSPSTILDIEDTEAVILSLNNTSGADWRFNSANNGTFRFSDEGDSDVEFILNRDGDLTITGDLTANGSTFPDYVFEPDYSLMPLDELAAFIAENKHLPNVPTAEQVDGGKQINMTKLQVTLLEKVEELTLYLLEQQEINKQQQEIINELRARLAE